MTDTTHTAPDFRPGAAHTPAAACAPSTSPRARSVFARRPGPALRLVGGISEPSAHDGDVVMLDRRARSRAGRDATESPVIRTLLAEGHGLVRAGLRVLLEDQADMTVADEAASGQEAVELALRTRPDVVVMDAALPGLDALEATREIAAHAPEDSLRVLLLAASETDEFIFEALHAGASGLLVKDDDPSELLRTATAIAARYVGPDRADEFGQRNGVPGELVVRVRPAKVLVNFDIMG